MQTRKRTISDLPWFCQNQVYDWLPDYKAMRSRVVRHIALLNEFGHIIRDKPHYKKLVFPFSVGVALSEEMVEEITEYLAAERLMREE